MKVIDPTVENSGTITLVQPSERDPKPFRSSQRSSFPCSNDGPPLTPRSKAACHKGVNCPKFITTPSITPHHFIFELPPRLSSPVLSQRKRQDEVNAAPAAGAGALRRSYGTRWVFVV